MRTLTGLIIMLSFITLPLLKLYMDWRRYAIKEHFVEEFQRQGVQFTTNGYTENLVRLNEDFWRHRRVVYVPFIYKGKRVTTQRFTNKNSLDFGYGQTTFYYHGKIYFELS